MSYCEIVIGARWAVRSVKDCGDKHRSSGKATASSCNAPRACSWSGAVSFPDERHSGSLETALLLLERMLARQSRTCCVVLHLEPAARLLLQALHHHAAAANDPCPQPPVAHLPG